MNIYQKSAHIYNNQFAFTSIPIRGKTALVTWANFQRPISPSEIDAMTTSRTGRPAWDWATGLNALCGVGDLTLLDFDNVTDRAIQTVVEALGLQHTGWIACTPGRGPRHLWLRVPGLADHIIVGKVDLNACPEYADSSNERHHIEIRHRGHYGVLSPSEHPTRPGRYSFVNGLPTDPPPIVSPGALLAAYALVTIPKPEQAPATHQAIGVTYATGDKNAIYVAENCLKRLAPGRADDYDQWIRIGMALCGLGRAGLDLWDQWSRNSPKYAPGVCERAWRYLTPDRGVSQKTLTWLAAQDSPTPPKPFVSVVNVADLDRLHLPADAINAILGHAPYFGEPRPVTDRSMADWIAVKRLIQAGATDDQIVGVFKHYPIGRGKYAERGDGYLATTIQRARAAQRG